MKRVILVLAVAMTAACSSQPKVEPAPAAPVVAKSLPTTLSEAVASDRRSDKNKLRDQARHPQQTLEFFDIKRDQTVMEINPASGWYTEILAPYLAEKGHYIAAVRNTDMTGEGNADLHKWLDANPDVASKITFAKFGEDKTPLAPADSVDRIVTFRNVHNWMMSHNEKKVFKAFYAALKPGGILGVVEHRAGKNNKDKHGEKGYVSEKAVIAMAKSAGFELLEKSEINANPKDTKNYPDGVWDLPPTLKKGDQDRDKYLAIGESDRMTLKFIKPQD